LNIKFYFINFSFALKLLELLKTKVEGHFSPFYPFSPFISVFYHFKMAPPHSEVREAF